MNLFANLSLRKHLILSFTTIILIVGVVSILFIRGYFQKVMLNESLLIAEGNMDSYEQVNRINIKLYDFHELYRNTEQMKIHKATVYMRLDDVLMGKNILERSFGGGANVLTEMRKISKVSDPPSVRIDSRSKKYVSLSKFIADTDGSALALLTVVLDLGIINKYINRSSFILIVSWAISLILIIGLICLLSNKITKPLQDLGKKLTESKLLPLSVTTKGIPSDIMRLIKSYNIMINKISDYEDLIKKQATLVAIGQMSCMIAHDLRSPIGVLKGYVDTKSLADKDDDEIAHSRCAENSVNRLNNMADDLVNYSKATKITKKVTDLTHLLDNKILPEIKSSDKAKNVKLNLSISSPKIKILADEEKFERIFINLITNSIQAIEHNSGEINVSVEVKDNKDLIIQISDNGKGIDKKYHEKIFDGFFSIGKKGGTGLGLAFCRQAIEAHGGTINVESELGKGSRFLIAVPNCIVGENVQPILTKETKLNFKNKNVAVIDDDDGVRLFWGRKIKGTGGKMVFETDLPEKIFTNENFNYDDIDLALIDYSFPASEYNGIDVIKHFKQKGVREIYLCTGFYGDDEIKEKAMNAGAIAVIKKE